MSSTAKGMVREAIERLPDDASVEDVMERLYLLSKINRGLDAADRGDVVSHEDAAQLLFNDTPARSE